MSGVWDLYKKHPSFVLGFHGCDAKVGEAVLAGKQKLSFSKNPYDWLGNGIYFWEGNPARALEFAENAISKEPRTTKGQIERPFVLGAIIDLGFCCNLSDTSAIDELKEAHKAFAASLATTKLSVENQGGSDRKARFLDCAVITAMHELRAEAKLAPYDTVRAPFWEGEEIYPGAGFRERTHIQIAVVNQECVRGYFRPLLNSPSHKSRRKK